MNSVKHILIGCLRTRANRITLVLAPIREKSLAEISRRATLEEGTYCYQAINIDHILDAEPLARLEFRFFKALGRSPCIVASIWFLVE